MENKFSPRVKRVTTVYPSRSHFLSIPPPLFVCVWFLHRTWSCLRLNLHFLHKILLEAHLLDGYNMKNKAFVTMLSHSLEPSKSSYNWIIYLIHLHEMFLM